ncbi:hypothetical protein COF64_24640 [Bacillus sp. AFS043905]|nr:hypothetical protein COF64_24640 [Bacillus sp. AFS043905]
MERKVRDSCGKSVAKGETPQASAEEAHGPPAESECLEWKSLHIPLLEIAPLPPTACQAFTACTSRVPAFGKRVSGGNVSHFTMGIVFRVRMPYRKYRNKPIYYL